MKCPRTTTTWQRLWLGLRSRFRVGAHVLLFVLFCFIIVVTIIILIIVVIIVVVIVVIIIVFIDCYFAVVVMLCSFVSVKLYIYFVD